MFPDLSSGNSTWPWKLAISIFSSYNMLQQSMSHFHSDGALHISHELLVLVTHGRVTRFRTPHFQHKQQARQGPSNSSHLLWAPTIPSSQHGFHLVSIGFHRLLPTGAELLQSLDEFFLGLLGNSRELERSWSGHRFIYEFGHLSCKKMSL